MTGRSTGSEPRPGGWSPARRRLAALAGVLATLTALAGAILGGTADHVIGAMAWSAVVAAAVFSPAWIPAQVIGGQIIAASLLLGGRASRIVVMVVIAAVIAIAELLAAVARMESTLERTPRRALRRAAAAAAMGTAVFGAVILLAGLPGPTGLPAIGIAALACIGLAILLVRSASSR